MKEGNKYGAHRVIEPKGVLPQPAWKIDNTMEIYDNEILIDVDTLNIDAASFTQIEEAEGGDVKKMARHSLGIIKERGKHHNPDTGSGGMLLGTIAEIGPKLKDRDLKVGDRIATLVSLSLTPLKVDEVISTNKDTCQVKVKGQAILFESGIYAKIPADMDEALALAVLDVAGAPAQAAKLSKPGQTVFIVGAGGKSGILCAYEARKRVGITGRIIGLVHGDAGKKRLEKTGLADVIFQGSATDQLFVYNEIAQDHRRRDGRPHDQLRRHPEHRDVVDPRDQGRRPRVLLLDGDELHVGRARRRGHRRRHDHDHRQRLHEGPRRDRAQHGAREPDAHGALQGDLRDRRRQPRAGRHQGVGGLT